MTLESWFVQGGLWNRRVINAPVVAAAALTFEYNTKLTGDIWYKTDGTGIVYRQGGYEKADVGTGTLAFHKYSIAGAIHSMGAGDPVSRPTTVLGTYTDRLGRFYTVGGDPRLITTDPTGTSIPFVHASYVPHPADRQDIYDEGGDGGFSWLRNGGFNGFRQWQGDNINYTENLIFFECWNYLAEHTAALKAAHYRDNGIFLGGNAGRTQALRELQLRITAAEFELDTVIYGDNRIGHGGLHLITSFVEGVVTESLDELFYRGPHATIDDVHTIVEDALAALQTVEVHITQASYDDAADDDDVVHFLAIA